MNKLIVGNLVHRPLRSIISALAVAIEVVMILSITALFYGILNGSRTQNAGIGMDMTVRPGAASAFLNTSSASADVRVAPILAQLPHVQVVSPVNIKLTAGTSLENIYGIDFKSFDALRPFVFLEGHPFEHPFDLIIDDLQAKSGKGTRVGDTVKVLNHDFTVCGIVDHGKGARKYIQLTTMDALENNPGKASAFFLRTESGASAEEKTRIQDAVRREVTHTDGMQDWTVQTLDEMLSALTPEKLPGFNIALRVVISIATVIGFLVIFQSMYTAVLERTREIGILKSMGAGPASIVSVVLRETGLLAIVGVLLGLVGTHILSMVLRHRFPTLSFQLSLRWDLIAVAIAFGGALIGAMYPALKAARKDPIDALSYE